MQLTVWTSTSCMSLIDQQHHVDDSQKTNTVPINESADNAAAVSAQHLTSHTADNMIAMHSWKKLLKFDVSSAESC